MQSQGSESHTGTLSLAEFSKKRKESRDKFPGSSSWTLDLPALPLRVAIDAVVREVIETTEDTEWRQQAWEGGRSWIEEIS
jgi:hypothetical protein